jgi:hypothetical protein
MVMGKKNASRTMNFLANPKKYLEGLPTSWIFLSESAQYVTKIFRHGFQSSRFKKSVSKNNRFRKKQNCPPELVQQPDSLEEIYKNQHISLNPSGWPKKCHVL